MQYDTDHWLIERGETDHRFYVTEIPAGLIWQLDCHTYLGQPAHESGQQHDGDGPELSPCPPTAGGVGQAKESEGVSSCLMYCMTATATANI